MITDPTTTYLREERLAILSQGGLVTRSMEAIAAEEVRQYEADQALEASTAARLANIERLAQRNRRNYALEKRFLKKPRICGACDCVIDEDGCGCNPVGA